MRKLPTIFTTLEMDEEVKHSKDESYAATAALRRRYLREVPLKGLLL